ncbi:hypothetical protein GUJ93_ZPchr0001g31342 [Zizania palustris]|uniref:Uncharacterized protein n=1 Tax=Zizania palustris TaxID=103762 RepID=A0A8J5VL30_ZIZPA|nr:hypothetical protein GUJ93_ZPchr0001g31342 [Zizania palustris]
MAPAARAWRQTGNPCEHVWRARGASLHVPAGTGRAAGGRAISARLVSSMAPKSKLKHMQNCLGIQGSRLRVTFAVADRQAVIESQLQAAGTFLGPACGRPDVFVATADLQHA